MDNSNFQENQTLDEIAAAGNAAMSDEELKERLGQMSNDEALEVFAEQLLIEGNYPEQDPDVRAEMRMDLKEQMSAKINSAIMEALPEDKITELDDLISSNNATSDNVGRLIQESGIDTSKVAGEALAEFRKEYLGEDNA